MKKDLSFNEPCLQESVFSSASDSKVEDSSKTKPNIEILSIDFEEFEPVELVYIEDKNSAPGWLVEYPVGYMYSADDPECVGLLPVQDPNNVVGWSVEEQISESEVMTQQTIIDLTLEVFRKYPLIKRIL